MKGRNEEGFTFIETVIVIAIILILSAGVGFSAMKYVDRARVASARNQISAYKLALESYYLDCGRYPSAGQGLVALWEKPALSPVPESWAGPYVDREVAGDPWGRPFEYSAPGENGLPFGILSLGADGLRGGEGNDADVASWK